MWENPFLKSTKHKPPSAGANVCRTHIIHSDAGSSLRTIGSHRVRIVPRRAPPCTHRTPTGRESSGSDPALSMSVFYSAGWRFSFFPSFLCACVALFNWCNEPPLCCQQKRGRITATARRSRSPLCIAGTHCKSVIGHLNPTVRGCEWFVLLYWRSLPDFTGAQQLLLTSHTECYLCHFDFTSAHKHFIWQWNIMYSSEHGNFCTEERHLNSPHTFLTLRARPVLSHASPGRKKALL